MDDISIGLLKGIKKSFSSGVEDSKTINDLLKKLDDKKADYEDAQKYAIEVGELLSKSFEENIDSASLPNGKMYYNIAKKVVDPELKDGFEKVSDYSTKVQKILNEDAKIGLKVQKPVYNQARSNGIVRRLADAESYDDVSWILKDPVVNFNQSVVDDTIKVNAEAHYKVGMHPKITRKVVGKACDWCMNLAGTYEYPDDVPDEVYHRHRDCRCIVTYNPGNGKTVQDVHTKKWSEISSRKESNAEYTRYVNERQRETKTSLLLQQENTQNYKPVIRGDSKIFDYNSSVSLNVKKVDSYKNYDIYVSDNVNIKRKALHNIKTRNVDAMNEWGIKRKPKIVIFGEKDGITAYGKYDAITNTVFYSEDIADKRLHNSIRTEYHEMWHMKQAENFITKHGEITEKNYFEYIKSTCDEAKKNIDTLGITEYNVSEISSYAAKNYLFGRFDEVEAEYNALVKKG